MTRLGFVLASDSCIGCHACTVACKSEHDVPLGVNRTWVKYIETGEFPDTGAHVHRDALQPVRRRAVHLDLSDPGAVPSAERRGRLRRQPVHRVQGVHERLPVRRDLHQPRDEHGTQVQLLQPPRRGRARTGLRDRVPDTRDHHRRPRRSDVGDQPDRGQRPRSPCGHPSRAPNRRSSTAARRRRRSTRRGR